MTQSIDPFANVHSIHHMCNVRCHVKIVVLHGARLFTKSTVVYQFPYETKINCTCCLEQKPIPKKKLLSFTFCVRRLNDGRSRVGRCFPHVSAASIIRFETFHQQNIFRLKINKNKANTCRESSWTY